MYNELTVKNGSKNYKCFLQDGFFYPAVQISPLHKHNYAEIHIVSNGNIEFNIGNELHRSENGNLFIIPSNVYHCVTGHDPDAIHSAFQIEYNAPEFMATQISEQTASDFVKEIEASAKTNDYSAVSAYISLFCSRLCSDPTSISPVLDYRFLISEFFSRHYNKDLRLSDLSKSLYLSERQTERLVEKYTGNTFKNELTEIRMNVARHLLSTTDMSHTEVALYVGYRSYSGFWKAFKKHGEQC